MENLSENIFSKIKGLNIDIVSLPEKIKEFKKIIPIINTFFPIIKEWEKTNVIKENERIIYSAIAEEDEIFIFVFIITQNKDLETVISKELFKFKVTELIEKLNSFLPGN